MVRFFDIRSQVEQIRFQYVIREMGYLISKIFEMLL